MSREKYFSQEKTEDVDINALSVFHLSCFRRYVNN